LRFDSEKVYSVYFLRDAGSNEVRYIGKAKDTETRLKVHMNANNKDVRVEKLEWIKRMKDEGCLPTMDVVLSKLSEKQAYRVEARLIMLHTQMRRHRLLNVLADCSQDIGCFGSSFVYKSIPCMTCDRSVRRQRGIAPKSWKKVEGGAICPVCLQNSRLKELQFPLLQRSLQADRFN
jgi:hypothetical protein